MALTLNVIDVLKQVKKTKVSVLGELEHLRADISFTLFLEGRNKEISGKQVLENYLRITCRKFT